MTVILFEMRAVPAPTLCRLSLALLAAAFALPPRTQAADDYTASVEAWRVDRTARLLKPDDWLSLIGLSWLQPGDNTVGTAPDNTVQLPAGPAHFGTVTVAPGGIVTFKPAADAYALIDGLPAPATELRYRGGLRPSLVQSGTVSFFVVSRDNKLALRVRDTESPRRKNFAGLDYFPIDPAWRIEAQWVAFDPPQQVNFTDVLGGTSPAPVPGKAVFTHDGRTFELLPIDEGANRPLFFVIADPTNGRETHGGGRFLYTAWPKDGRVILDFNHLENPPCAFTPFTTCPLPPKENQLPFPIPAGEKAYRGGPP